MGISVTPDLIVVKLYIIVFYNFYKLNHTVQTIFGSLCLPKKKKTIACLLLHLSKAKHKPIRR